MMPKFLPPVNATAITLNSAWLRNRVAELGLKQWLAEQIGVDKKTVIRWLHGHVRRVHLSNATALAGVLGCRVEDLQLPRDAVDLARPDDQRAAAALLATSSLLDQVGRCATTVRRSMPPAAGALYLLDGTAMQRSINHGAFAILELRRGDVDAATPHAEAAIAHAQRGDYRRGVAMGALVMADIHARRGEATAALEALAAGRAGFARLGIEEGFNREFEARVLRLVGRADEALTVLDEGMQLAEKFPVEAAWLQVERVLIQQARGDADGARDAAQAAARQFERLAAPRMVGAMRAMAAGMPPRVPRAVEAKPLT